MSKTPLEWEGAQMLQNPEPPPEICELGMHPPKNGKKIKYVLSWTSFIPFFKIILVYFFAFVICCSLHGFATLDSSIVKLQFES